MGGEVSLNDVQRKALQRFHEFGKEGLSRIELAKCLGCSYRTADRAMADLRADGAEFERVWSVRSRTYRFHLTKSPRSDRTITLQARLALQVAGLAVEQGGSQHFRSLLDRLEWMAEEQMTAPSRASFRALRSCVLVRGGVEDPIEPDDHIFEAILKGLGDKGIPSRIQVRYRAASSPEIAVREIIPYRIIQDLLSGGTYLLGWEPAKGTIAQLRLSRIEEVKVLGRPSAQPHPELLERAAEYQIGGWFSTEEPFEVRIRIRGANWVRSFQEASPGFPDFEIDPAKDQATAEIRFKTNTQVGVIRWILQLGSCAKVIAPEGLKAEVQQELRQALTAYEK